MPKTQVVSPKIRQPSGHFSQATMIEARGRLVFISGMTARRADGSIAGIGDIEADATGLRKCQICGGASRRHDGRYLPRRCLCP